MNYSWQFFRTRIAWPQKKEKTPHDHFDPRFQKTAYHAKPPVHERTQRRPNDLGKECSDTALRCDEIHDPLLAADTANYAARYRRIGPADDQKNDPTHNKSIKVSNKIFAHIILEGVPISKKRPRICKGRMYDPLSAQKYGAHWLIADFMRNNGLKTLSDQAVAIKMTFHMPIPKSLSEAKRKALAAGLPCSKLSDVDNICKFYFDVMNKCVYKDDRQVASVEAHKIYSDNPRTEIEIYTMGHDETT